MCAPICMCIDLVVSPTNWFQSCWRRVGFEHSGLVGLANTQLNTLTRQCTQASNMLAKPFIVMHHFESYCVSTLHFDLTIHSSTALSFPIQHEFVRFRPIQNVTIWREWVGLIQYYCVPTRFESFWMKWFGSIIWMKWNRLVDSTQGCERRRRQEIIDRSLWDYQIHRHSPPFISYDSTYLK